MTTKKQNDKQETFDLNTAIADLRAIAQWFEGQEEIDVEVGLEKIKQGAALVKACKTRLSGLENAFEEVRKELDEEV